MNITATFTTRGFSLSAQIFGNKAKSSIIPLAAVLVFTGCANNNRPKEMDSTLALGESAILRGNGETRTERIFNSRQIHNYLTKLEGDGPNSEFLFLASTLGAPRNIPSQLPNYQGDGKIVKFRIEKKFIKVHQVEEDHRFANNPINQRPILMIPINRVSPKCDDDEPKNCSSDKESEKVLRPRFNDIVLTHLSELKIFVEDSCFSEVAQNVLLVELNQDVMNVEVEKEYQLNKQFDCITSHFDFKSYVVKNPSFKIRYFYSIVRLNRLASEDYEPIEYPIQDHFKYGFFASRIEKLGNYFAPAYLKEISYLNRFNPGKEGPRVIHFYLSANFNKPENLYLRAATHKTVKKVNYALREAQANIRLNLVHVGPHSGEKRSGDLRHNSIVLIEEPLTNGLLGYAPSVANPRTGEILQAHTNMYPGVLKSTVRRTYRNMVSLSRKRPKGQPEKTTPSEAPQGNAHFLTLPNHDNPKSVQRHHELKHLWTPKRASLPISLGQTIQSGEKIKMARRGMSGETLEEQDLLKHHQNFVEVHSQNNAYHAGMVNFEYFGQSLIPKISQIPGVQKSDGTLLPWNQLSKIQRDRVSDIVVVNLYIGVLTHELGHNLGLRHNFMGSTDVDNFYTEEQAQAMGLSEVPQSSSIMDYLNEANENASFGKYDIAALRYAYNRTVALDSGEIVKVTTTLKDLEAKITEQNKSLKNYLFCSDESVKASAYCNRFDKGTGLTEIATFYANSYRNGYEQRNWRNERTYFSSDQLPRYILRNMWGFRAMKEIHETFELYAEFYGKTRMTQGCQFIELLQFPQVCLKINDIRNATVIVGNLLLEILKTPDLTCALRSKSDQENETDIFLSLRDIYKKMKLRGEINHVPSTCFDPTVQRYLARPSNHLGASFSIKGEAGKYLNSIKDPKRPFRSELKVRGIWSDKMLAIRYLTGRISENTGRGEKNGSLADLPFISIPLNNFFEHIVTKAPIHSPVKFRKSDGTEYEEDHLQLAGINYTVPENRIPFIARFFGLPRFGEGILNKALITNTVWYNWTDSDQQKTIAESFQDNLSIFKTRRITPTSDEQTELIYGKYKYIVEKENRIVLSLLEVQKAWDDLVDVPLEIAEEAFSTRMTPPESADEDTAIVVTKFNATQIETFIKYFEGLGEDYNPNKLPAPPLDAVFRLKAPGLKNALNVLRQMNTPPPDAGVFVKKAYTVDVGFLRSFIDGSLQKRVENIEESIKLLYSPEVPN